MKMLIVEDDIISRMFLQELLKPLGETHIAVNGWEAIWAFRRGVEAKAPYDLICLDLMIPRMDGHQVLHEIRQIEKENGIPSSRGTKIIMTTALGDPSNVFLAFRQQCDAYLPKPFRKQQILDELQRLGLVSSVKPSVTPRFEGNQEQEDP